MLLDQIIGLQEENESLKNQLDNQFKKQENPSIFVSQAQNDADDTKNYPSNVSLRSKKDEVNKNFDKLMQNDSEISKSSEKLSKKIVDLQNDFQKSLNSITSRKNNDSNEKILEMLEDQREKIDEFENEVNQLKKLDKKNKKIISDLKSNIEELEQEAQQINQIFEDHMTYHHREEQQLESPTFNNARKYSQKNQDLEDQIQRLNDLYEDTTDKLDDKTAECQRLIDKLSKFENPDPSDATYELKNYGSNVSFNDKTDKMNATLDKLIEIESNRQIINRELDKKMVQLNKEYQRSTRSIASNQNLGVDNNMTEENKKLEDKINELNNEINEQKKLEKKNKKIITELKANCEDLSEEAKQLNKIFEEHMKNHQHTAHDESPDKNKEQQRLTDLTNEYHKKIEELEEMYGKIQDELEDKNHENEDLKDEIEKMKARDDINEAGTPDRNYRSNLSLYDKTDKMNATLDKLIEIESNRQIINRELDKKMVQLNKEYQRSTRSIASNQNLGVDNNMTEENKKLEDKINELNNEINEQKKLEKKNKKIITELKANCEDLTEEAQQLNKIFEEHMKDHQPASPGKSPDKNKDKQVLVTVEAEHRQKIDEMESEHKKKIDELEDLYSETLDKLDEKIKECEKLNEELENKGELEQKSKGAAKRNDRLTDQLSEQKQKSKEENDKLSEQVSEQNQKLKEQHDKLNEQVSEQDKKLKQSKKEVYMKDLELGDLTEDFEAKIKDLNDQIEVLLARKADDDDVIKQLAELENKVANQQKLLQNAEQKNSGSQSDRKQLDSKIAEQLEQIADKDNLIDELKSKVIKKDKEIKKLTTDLEEALEKIEETDEDEDKYAELRIEISKLKTQLKNARNETFVLETKISHLNKVIKEYEEEFKEHGIDYEELHKKNRGKSTKKKGKK